MKLTTLSMLLLFCSFAWAKDTKPVQVIAAHAVTREDAGVKSQLDAVFIGAGRPRTTVDSFNLDTKIDGENVFLACDVPTGCPAPAPGKYEGEIVRGKYVRFTYELPVTHKKTRLWYHIAGTLKDEKETH